MTIPNVLSIAGSDSSGGAGIQADIKAISATGGYGATVIAALTAQNTQSVSAISPVGADFVDQQLQAVLSDMPIAAIKVGMLGDPDVIEVVASHIRKSNVQHIVVDPVMVSANGDPLLATESIAALKQHLFGLATVLTPNLYEAGMLLNTTPEALLINPDKYLEKLSAWPAVVLKGIAGSEADHHDDWLIEQGICTVIAGRKVHTNNTHGTGCTYSSAVACYLAQGCNLIGACQQAKLYISKALQASEQLQVGQGKGPANHFYHMPEIN